MEKKKRKKKSKKEKRECNVRVTFEIVDENRFYQSINRSILISFQIYPTKHPRWHPAFGTFVCQW